MPAKRDRPLLFASLLFPVALRTPKGLPLSSRGWQPTDGSEPPSTTTLKGLTVNFTPVRPRQGRVASWPAFSVGSHPRLPTVFPLRGTSERSNLFPSHWWNQWLTSKRITERHYPRWAGPSRNRLSRMSVGHGTRPLDEGHARKERIASP